MLELVDVTKVYKGRKRAVDHTDTGYRDRTAVGHRRTDRADTGHRRRGGAALGVPALALVLD